MFSVMISEYTKMWTLSMIHFSQIKVEYHDNGNPLKNSEKYSISLSKVNVSNN